MTYDVFTYNGEQDLLEIHLNVLNDYVDQFIIVEAPTTFSGQPKPLYYELHKERFKDFWPKIKHFVIDENYTEAERQLAEASPNTQGAAHWKREFLQKESIKTALTHLADDDIVYIGDVDEIWQPTLGSLYKLKLKVYSYWLNNASSEEFWGTIKVPYGILKVNCLNHLRSSGLLKTNIACGWHFTSMGGYDEVKRKLENSYTRESYWTEGVEANLEQNLAQNKDFLGRDFTYRTDESDWPQYLKDNREKYKDMLK